MNLPRDQLPHMLSFLSQITFKLQYSKHNFRFYFNFFFLFIYLGLSDILIYYIYFLLNNINWVPEEILYLFLVLKILK